MASPCRIVDDDRDSDVGEAVEDAVTSCLALGERRELGTLLGGLELLRERGWSYSEWLLTVERLWVEGHQREVFW